MLDFPGVNCSQCRENYEEDGLEPDCIPCPVYQWDRDTRQILACYNMASPWGDLNKGWMEESFASYQIPHHDRPRYRRTILAIYRAVKEHHAQQQQQSGN